MIGILFIVIAVVVLLMRSMIRPSKNEPIQYAGVGTITKQIQDNCRIIFYVEFFDQNGKVHVGKSIRYKLTKGKYQVGDSANIKYFFSAKGRPFVIINDEDLVSCEQAAKPVSTTMLVVAIMLIVLGVICLVSAFVG